MSSFTKLSNTIVSHVSVEDVLNNADNLLSELPDINADNLTTALDAMTVVAGSGLTTVSDNVTVGRVPVYHDTTGKKVKQSLVTIDTSGSLKGVKEITTTGDINTKDIIAQNISAQNISVGGKNVPNVDDISTTSLTNTYSCKKVRELISGGLTTVSDNVKIGSVPVYHETTGKKVEQSLVTIDAFGSLGGVKEITTTGDINTKDIIAQNIIAQNISAQNISVGGKNVPNVDDISTTSLTNTYSCKKVRELISGGLTTVSDNVKIGSVPVYHETTGKKVEQSLVTIDAFGSLGGVKEITTTGDINTKDIIAQNISAQNISAQNISVGGKNVPSLNDGLTSDEQTWSSHMISTLIGDISAGVGSNTTNIESLNISSSSRAEAIEKLSSSSKSHSEDIDSLNDSVQSNTGNINSLNVSVQSNTDDIKTLNDSVHSNTDDINTLNDSVQSNTDDINTLKSGGLITPSTTTDNTIVIFDGVNGDKIKNTGVVVNDKNITGVQNMIVDTVRPAFTSSGSIGTSAIKYDTSHVNTTFTNEVSYAKTDTPDTPDVGKIKTYFKQDGDFYKKDENGLESKITGSAESAIGNVMGPSSSVSNTVALYNGTTGKLLNNSTIIVDGTDTSVKFNAYALKNTGAILPNANSSYDIGSTSSKFRDIHCSGSAYMTNVYASGAISAFNNNQGIGQLRVGDGAYAYIAEYGTSDSDTLYLHGTDKNSNKIYHNLPFSQVSDRNFKTNINPFKIDNPVDKINDLELMSFNLIGDKEEGSKDTAQLGEKQLQHGYIAQDVQVTFPEAVSTVDRYKTKENGDYVFDEHGNKVKETRYHLTTFYFTLLQNEAIKELSSTIRNLQERIAMLESR